MIQKKICMLGATAVGKTSLVRQYVQSIYSEKYHSTIGVKVDKKTLTIDNEDMVLMLWDVQGEDDHYKIHPSFLRGASGYLLVIDRTRRDTLSVAQEILKMVRAEVGDLPFLVLYNKDDLSDKFEISEDEVESAIETEQRALRTSAKTGFNVEEAFALLAGDLI